MSRFPSGCLAALGALALAGVSTAAEPPPLQTAHLGGLVLESGAVLKDLSLGYRTEGTLDRDKSNAVLFPTWFTGTTADLYEADAVAPVDTSKFFLITVDALANGVSSSPSNTESFPEITIRDMVNAEHRLVTDVLGIERLYAVMGISMGGMQTFEWMTAYPEMVERAVPIVGSPRLASYDVLLWESQMEAISLARAAGDAERAAPLVGMISMLALQTPSYHARKSPRARVDELLAAARAPGRQSVADRQAQLRAMLTHDVTKRFGGAMEKAAAVVTARTLVVVSRRDHMVTPEPALRFAALLGADTLILDNDCGHLGMSCDEGRSERAIRLFLE